MRILFFFFFSLLHVSRKGAVWFTSCADIFTLICARYFTDIAPAGKKTLGIMADGQADDDDDEGAPEEKRLADDVRADSKVRIEIPNICSTHRVKLLSIHLINISDFDFGTSECRPNGNSKQARQRHNESAS